MMQRTRLLAAIAVIAWAALGLLMLLTSTPAGATTGPAPIDSQCDWARPGADPYRGSRWDAVMRLDHISLHARMRLAWRVWRVAPDAQAAITRDGITSNTIALPADAQPWDMNFGRGRICTLVNRDRWLPDHAELVDLWCNGTVCAGVVRTCGNVFWTERIAPGVMTVRTAQQIAQQQGAARSVPEPPSWGLVLAAAVAAGWWRHGPRRWRG